MWVLISPPKRCSAKRNHAEGGGWATKCSMHSEQTEASRRAMQPASQPRTTPKSRSTGDSAASSSAMSELVSTRRPVADRDHRSPLHQFESDSVPLPICSQHVGHVAHARDLFFLLARRECGSRPFTSKLREFNTARIDNAAGSIAVQPPRQASPFTFIHHPLFSHDSALCCSTFSARNHQPLTNRLGRKRETPTLCSMTPPWMQPSR